MKKPSPIYLFVVLMSLAIAGFAFSIIFISLGRLGFILPIVLVFGIGGFFLFIAKGLNTAHFEERLKIRMICYNCKSEIEAGSDYCPKCGVNLNDKIECDYCGHLNPIDTTTCFNCKANLK